MKGVRKNYLFGLTFRLWVLMIYGIENDFISINLLFLNTFSV